MSSGRRGPSRPIDVGLAQGETFYVDDPTPVADRSHARHEESDASRISHDLSLNDNTRDSVVDNMLLSLDQIQGGTTNGGGNAMFPNSAGFYASFDDEEDMYAETISHAAPTIRRRPQEEDVYGHSHNSSFSSHYDMPPNTPQYHHLHRPNRSNGSSIAQYPQSTVGSSRGYHQSSASNDTQVPWQETQSYARQRRGTGSSKKGSKSSASSVDLGHHAHSARHPPPPMMDRSASYDPAFDHNVYSPPHDIDDSMLHRGRPNALPFNSAFESAPVPTVFSGRRRDAENSPAQTPQYPPQPSYAPPRIPNSRRSSVRSASGKVVKSSGMPSPADVRNQASIFYDAVTSQGLPPSPHVDAYVQGSMPAVSALRDEQTAAVAPPTPNKDKPGFFRRVFGSSRKEPASPASSLSTPPKTSADTRTDDRPRTTHTTASNSKGRTLSRPTTQNTTRDPSPQAPDTFAPPVPTLNKKHSSFFRRRKKSMVESMPPTLLPLQLQAAKNADIEAAQASPSSLSKVMNPYLQGSARHTPRQGSKTDVPRADQGSNLAEDAQYDTIAHNQGDGAHGANTSSQRTYVAPDAPASDSPKLKLKVKRGKNGIMNLQEPTFLADSSDVEHKSNSQVPSAASSTLALEENRRPKTSPVSGGFQQKSRLGETSTTDDEPSHTWHKSRDAESVNHARATDTGAQQPAAAQRVWLEPSSSEEHLDKPKPKTLRMVEHPYMESPIPPDSAGDVFHSATSLPLEKAESAEQKPEATPVHPNAPSDEDRVKAQKIFDGDEEFMSKDRAAAWLGESSDPAMRTRKAYMNLYDWKGFSILAAMRELCGRLALKAESQQVDRVIDAFAQRWAECNPTHGFKSLDIVHTITYSVLLLNTDLHTANVEQKMTRHQFVKNTLPHIRRQAIDADPEAKQETLRATPSTAARGFAPWYDLPPAHTGRESPTEGNDDRASFDNKRSRNRLSIRPQATRNDSVDDSNTANLTDNCTVLVKAPYEGNFKGWEMQVEVVLKEFFNSIRAQRLPLLGVEPSSSVQPKPSNNSLGVSSTLRRTPSVLSKTPSENPSYRGRSTDNRSAASRWSSKNRSRPRLYQTSTVGSSRTSLEDQSVWSPTGSSTWSKYSFGKTQTSMMSTESFGSHFAPADYQQSIGFANALSQAIIREEGVDKQSTNEEFAKAAPLLEDETLELAGAPWAKEGILKHKHHLEAIGKKAKDRAWNECFAVLEKGAMRLFSFSQNSKSQRHKGKGRPGTAAVVGGGNWAENAECLDTFPLRQTIASALPPPGYSKSRPYVFALSLPTGAVHLFQVGTADIVKEFVSSANYWSARLSKEPLIGGVSNIEYGWSDNVINTALLSRPESSASGVIPNPPGSAGANVPRPSIQSSIRSSLDQGSMSTRARLPGDKITISDWTPPVSSMMASTLMEVDQLRALQAYVSNVDAELAKHQELRGAMALAFTPRHPNFGKAMTNWERKSSYLLREIVKFRTYVEALNAAREKAVGIKKEQVEREEMLAKVRGKGNEAQEAVDHDGTTDGAGSKSAADDERRAGAESPTLPREERKQSVPSVQVVPA